MNSEGLSRIPPQNTEAEQSTLGSMMLDRQAIITASGMLTAADFYRPSHGIIFDAMCKLNAEESPVDLITLQDELQSRGSLDDVGGTEYLMALLSQVPSASRVAFYAEIMKEKSALRQVITAASEVHNLAYVDDVRAADLRAALVNMLLDQDAKSGKRGFISLQRAMDDSIKQMEDREQQRGERGIKLGLPSADRILSGFRPGLTVIAAGTGIGKTTLLLQIPRVNRLSSGAMFELEMGADQLSERILLAESGVDSYLALTGKLEGTDWGSIMEARNELRDVPLYISEDDVDDKQLVAGIQMAKLQHNIEYALVDYLGLIETSSKRGNDNLTAELGAVTRKLHKVGVALKIPIFLACQLSRAWESRKGKERRPMLRDLRDSGHIANNSVAVIFLHDPNWEDKQPGGAQVGAMPYEIDVAKWRFGPTGRFNVKCDLSRFRFYEETSWYESGAATSELPYWNAQEE